MRQSSKYYTFYHQLFLGLLVIAPLGCPSINYDRMPLDESNVTNYSEKAVLGDIPDIALAYSALPMSTAVSETTLPSNTEILDNQLDAVKKFPATAGLDNAIVAQVEAGVSALQTVINTEVKSLVIAATKDPKETKKLAINISEILKPTGAFDLFDTAMLNSGMVGDDIISIKGLMGQLKQSLEELYAKSTVIALQLVQSALRSELSNIDVYSKRLENAVANTDFAQKEAAKLLLLSVSLELSNLKELNHKLLSLEKVSSLFEASSKKLSDALPPLDAMLPLPDTKETQALKDSLNKLRTHAAKLILLAGEVKDYEVLKTPIDAFKPAIKNQFNNPQSVLAQSGNGDSLAQDTNLLTFSKKLKTIGPNKLIQMEDNPSSKLFLQAFAAYAQTKEPNEALGKVFFINADAITHKAKSLGFDETGTKKYFLAQLDRMSMKAAKLSNEPSLFALAAKDLPKGINGVDVLNHLSQAYVVILSNQPPFEFSDSHNEVAQFSMPSLSATEIKNLVRTKLHRFDKEHPLYTQVVADEVAKVFRAFVPEAGLLDVDKMATKVSSYMDSGQPVERFTRLLNRDIAQSYNIPLFSIEQAGLGNQTAESVEEIVKQDALVYLRKPSSNQPLSPPGIQDTQKIIENKKTVELFKAALKQEESKLDISGKFSDATDAVNEFRRRSLQRLGDIQHVAADDACAENKLKKSPGGMMGGTKDRNGDAYFQKVVSNIAWPAGGNLTITQLSKTVNAIINELAKPTGMGVPTSLNASFSVDNLKPIVTNCYLYKDPIGGADSEQLLKQKIDDVRSAIEKIRTDIKQSSLVVDDKHFSNKAIVDNVLSLRSFENGIAQKLNANLSSFAAWPTLPAPYFVNTTFAGYIGREFHTGKQEFTKINRRLYAYMFATILGESLNNADVPFSAANELYQDSKIGTGYVGKFETDMSTLKLAKRFVQGLLFNELANLADTYGSIMSTYYTLPPLVIKAFESGSSNFKTFFESIKSLLNQPIKPELADINSDSAAVMTAVSALLPDAVISMFNAQSSAHPHTVLQADAFLRALPTQPYTMGNFTTFYESLKAQGTAEPMDNLFELMNAIIAHHGVTPPAPNLIPPPAPLKSDRFITGKSSDYLKTTTNTTIDKNLMPIFDQLSGQVRKLEASADRIYLLIDSLFLF